jgi:hypothetical protein
LHFILHNFFLISIKLKNLLFKIENNNKKKSTTRNLFIRYVPRDIIVGVCSRDTLLNTYLSRATEGNKYINETKKKIKNVSTLFHNFETLEQKTREKPRVFLIPDNRAETAYAKVYPVLHNINVFIRMRY